MSVELLIYNREYVTDDPEKAAKAYRAGDVLAVMPGGHVWGNGEQPPAMLHLTVPGKVGEWEHLIEQAHHDEDTVAMLGLKSSLKHRRRFRIAPENLPAAALDALMHGRPAKLTKAELRAVLTSDREHRRFV